MMQVFAYRHLVPQQELLVAITGSRPVPAVWRPLLAGVQVASPTPVQVPLGGTAQVQVRAPQTLPGRIPSALKAARFELAAPPRGVTLRGTSVTPTGVILTVKADGCIADVGESGHLIVEVSTDASGSASGGQASARPRRVSLGVLPAIPIRVVRP
jgi:hypothetical protein